MKDGKLIVMEGSCDGVGKTTQSNLLKERLINENYEVTTHHFPTYRTYQGALVEHYLSGEMGHPDNLSPYLVNSFYAVDRAVTWNNKLKEKYESGNIILLDRYTTSSLIYQAANFKNIEEKKAFIEYVLDFEYNKLKIKEPDQVLFLNLPLELSIKILSRRTNTGGVKDDIYERDLDLLKRIYENALFIADYLKWDTVNCSKNNELRTIDEIGEDVYKLVRK